MGFLSKGKERQVAAMITAHLNKTQECLEQTKQTLAHYLAGQLEDAKSDALRTDHLETEADQIRRAIVDSLYQGAFLPVLRVNIHSFVERIDQVADSAELCCDLIVGQRPKIPQALHETYLRIMQDTLPMFGFLKEATEGFFSAGDHELIRKKVADISISESAIDDDEWKLTRAIYTSRMRLSQKNHLRRFLEAVTDMSDQIEDASDWLEVLLISSKV